MFHTDSPMTVANTEDFFCQIVRVWLVAVMYRRCRLTQVNSRITAVVSYLLTPAGQRQ